jgi:hypothetical protein
MAGYDSSTSTYYIQISPCVDELSRDITKEFPLVSSPKKKEDPFNFQPELVGLFHPIPTSFFVWIPSFTIPMRKKNTSQESRHQMGMSQKIVAKKKKMPKALWFHEFSKTFTPSAEKNLSPRGLVVGFPIVAALGLARVSRADVMASGGCLGWGHREFDQKPRHKSLTLEIPSGKLT